MLRLAIALILSTPLAALAAPDAPALTENHGKPEQSAMRLPGESLVPMAGVTAFAPIVGADALAPAPMGTPQADPVAY